MCMRLQLLLLLYLGTCDEDASLSILSFRTGGRVRAKGAVPPQLGGRPLRLSRNRPGGVQDLACD